jgi:predicted metalloprotease
MNMKPRISFFGVPLTVLIVVLAMLAFPAEASRSTAPSKPPDFPLNQLLPFASGHINRFWHQSFYASRLNYATPTMVPYTQPIDTPCGSALMNNAFYCPRSNSIYYDYNFMGRMYSQVGDYAAVSILAHEWGHLVQTQLGVARGGAFTIQLELQADCLSGAYTQYCQTQGALDPGDLEEAGIGLFKGGDPIGMPWFSSQAHGTAMQRIDAFLTGYKNGAQKCFGR